MTKTNGKITSSADNASITGISFSPDVKLLAIASIKGVTVVDRATGKELCTLTPEGKK